MNLPQRKNIRLKEYDYSQNGAYFITICIIDKKCLLWTNNVRECIARPKLSDIGRVIDIAIKNIQQKYKSVCVDKYVIMPNHVHMILILKSNDGHALSTCGRTMRAPTVSNIINQMKGYVSKQVGSPVWQKLFYDHIIRNEAEYKKIWEYIDTNQLKWHEDKYFV